MVEREPPQPGPVRIDPPSPARLVLLSFLMLFVELGLIRWSGAYILYLSFFTNFVLLASFLGVGVGFLRARAESDLFRYVPGLLAVLVSFLAVFPVQGGRVAGRLQFVGGFGWPALPKWVSLAVVFVLAFLIMAAIAQGVGRLFVRFEPLEIVLVQGTTGAEPPHDLTFSRLPPVLGRAEIGGDPQDPWECVTAGRVVPIERGHHLEPHRGDEIDHVARSVRSSGGEPDRRIHMPPIELLERGGLDA